jgi:solute carrier family 25 (mitochondrial carnitine/acylcarnitine transporter), member 20/29
MRVAALSALLFSPLAYASQVPLDIISSPADTISRPPHSTSTTLVDLLSADADYIQLLRLLQRTRLIPTLNKLNGSTLFAPTNDAIQRYALFTDYLALTDIEPNDNINERVRQQLLYHLLNYTLPVFPPQDSQVETYNTLHFPRIPPELPSEDPPSPPPWVPLPGGSLNNESQRLRAAVRADSTGYTEEPTAYINVDAWGQGGTPVVKPAVQGTDCLLLGIDDVLELPPSLGSIIRDTPSLSYLSTVLPESQMKSLENDPGLTVFLPEDDAWDDLHPVIKMYLESPFAIGDLRWIVGMHVADGKLRYSDRFGDGRRSMYILLHDIHSSHADCPQSAQSKETNS